MWIIISEYETYHEGSSLWLEHWKELRGTNVSVTEQPHMKLPGTLFEWACWRFLIKTVNIWRSRIWVQRGDVYSQLSKSFLFPTEGEFYLFFRKRHETQHLIIPLCPTLDFFFTSVSAFKNRKQIIMPERLQSLPIIPICKRCCFHGGSQGAVSAWEWRGEKEEELENGEEGQVARSSTVWNYSLDELLIVFPQLN